MAFWANISWIPRPSHGMAEACISWIPWSSHGTTWFLSSRANPSPRNLKGLCFLDPAAKPWDGGGLYFLDPVVKHGMTEACISWIPWSSHGMTWFLSSRANPSPRNLKGLCFLDPAAKLRHASVSQRRAKNSIVRHPAA